MINPFHRLFFRVLRLSILAIIFNSPLFSQIRLTSHGTDLQDISGDKCGYDHDLAMQQLALLGDHWGYGYDDLLRDLEDWRRSPYITIDSLGASVQNRALWQLTITSDIPAAEPRRTVFVHARTHPNEVQGWWVTKELIYLLLSEDGFARFMRENCVLYIIPMYNPDGVELELPRENANGVDIESNWDKDPVEPEVAVLRSRFSKLMDSQAPIEAALNMHSAFACKRYFVYHDAAGTSEDFTVLEQTFIEGIRNYFLEGIEPWYYFISWTNGTPRRYPESWFWLNHGEAVMALTYEDMNCPAASEYDRTAFALLHGVADYLGLIATAVAERAWPVNHGFTLHQNYPNPFNPSTTIGFELPDDSHTVVRIINLRGQTITTLMAKTLSAGMHRIDWDGTDDRNLPVASGVYLVHLQAGDLAASRKLTLLK